MILVLLLSVGAQAADWETVAELAVGFDDNVAQSPTGKGSGFSMYGLDTAAHLPMGANRLLLSGFLYGRYQQYWAAEDNYLVGAGTELAVPLIDGILTPELAVDGRLVRDGEQPDEDRDEYGVEGRLRWFAGGRLTVLLLQSWTRQFYDETECEGPGCSRGMIGGGRFGFRRLDRQDDLWITEMALSFPFTPSWVAGLSATYSRNSSTIMIESFEAHGLSLGITWMPSAVWELTAGSGLWTADYDHDRYIGARTDRLLTADAGISWIHRSWELFFNVHWEYNDSSWESETYHNTVTGCGVLWHF
ncbi:MAG: hypothetical protein HY788_15275 [Deltaproteobacteria bacterium]|nr:hypothetical protein [Deltaproteobacteria bacterium]